MAEKPDTTPTVLKNKSGNCFVVPAHRAEFLLRERAGYSKPEPEEAEAWCKKHNPKLAPKRTRRKAGEGDS